MLDTVIKIAALGAFVGFLAILIFTLRSADLTTIGVIVVLMAVYDFFVRPLLLRRRHSR